VRGTRQAFALGLRLAGAPLHRARLWVRPPRVRPGAVTRAYGGDLAAALERVMRAMPTVARFEQRLRKADAGERAELLAVADAVTDHRFDLLGSGPTELGDPIAWERDFKAGRSWPLVHISRVPVVFPDASDIKVPWELSRFQHLPVLAAAWRLGGERRHLDEIGAQLESWIDSSPVETGPNWACTMDVAIRASNWVATLALLGKDAAEAPWIGRVLESLLMHGRFVRSHLEWAEVRGNHYLSDVVGLLPVAALFGAGAEGRAWTEWAAAELEREMDHQVRPDGCDHEASIPYHRLVAELMICGTQAVDALLPGRLPHSHRDRLAHMLEFVCDYTRPDGLAPQVGDADDGRFLPLGDYGRADPRSHLHLFAQEDAEYTPAEGHAAYPDGGYWTMRHGGLYAIVRCGDVGVGGFGSHAHNDQLSFELALGVEPIVIDPGSYLYTADLEARALFRSTGFHAALRIGGEEQNPLLRDAPFAMEDQTRAEAVAWKPGDTGAVFEGMHHGYERLDPPATHIRRIELGKGRLSVRDTVLSQGAHDLEWTFPLAPCEVSAAEGRAVAQFPTARLEIESPGLRFEVEDGWYSPSYGVRIRTPFLRAERRGRPGCDETTFELRAIPRALA
jgi:Heparinase II/III-like protein/Heparinase II/III N-terminus